MDYLTKLIEFQNKIGGWEIEDAVVAQSVTKDPVRKENWLKEYERIEADIINSSLSSSDKAYFLNRINQSRSYLKNSEKDLLSKYGAYALAFVLGAICCHFLSQGMNELQDNFVKNVVKGFYEELGEKNAF
jgi:ribosomal protein S15P/S13E